MPFRVHQFGTPVPSLRSSQPRARVFSLLPLSLSCLPAVFGPFQTSAKLLRGSASRSHSRRTNERSFPGRTRYPGIGKRAYLLFLAPFSRAVNLFRCVCLVQIDNCAKSFVELHKHGIIECSTHSSYVLCFIVCPLQFNARAILRTFRKNREVNVIYFSE